MEKLKVDLQKMGWLLHQKNLRIAEEIGLAPNTLYRKVRGQREFKISELNALAEALNVSVLEFVSIQ